MCSLICVVSYLCGIGAVHDWQAARGRNHDGRGVD